MNSAEHAREQLKMISELEDGWGYSPDEHSPPYTKEAVEFYSNILEELIKKVGDNKIPEIFPVDGAKQILLEFEKSSYGSLCFSIHETGLLEVSYFQNITYSEQNYTQYKKNIVDTMATCINRYFNNHLYNNLPKGGIR